MRFRAFCSLSFVFSSLYLVGCNQCLVRALKRSTTERERSDRCQRTLRAQPLDIGRFAPVL